jgi:hypothetical protein
MKFVKSALSLTPRKGASAGENIYEMIGETN